MIIHVLNESREGELQTYNRERMYKLYVCSQLVKVGVVLLCYVTINK